MISDILQNYETENAGVRTNMARILAHGKLGGTGKVVILPVDQGFEHGPDKSFATNPVAYDPLYHFQLAVDGGVNAFAAPLGMLELGAAKYAGAVPLILKINSSSSLGAGDFNPDQAIYGSVDRALQLGCVGIGLTVYPGSPDYLMMIERLAPIMEEAKLRGLCVVVWSYPRGEDLSKEDETSLDVIAYAAHMACLLGANIVKVKPPTSRLRDSSLAGSYSNLGDIADASTRIKAVVRSCFAGGRMVLFSGGAGKSYDDVMQEVKAIKDGGGTGSIIGRNLFTRPRDEALKMLGDIVKTYSA